MTSLNTCNKPESGDCDNLLTPPKFESLRLKTFQFTEHKGHCMENDFDPENNFYNNTQNNCEYYTEEQFNRNILTTGRISIIHFNSRSLNSNLLKIKYCLRQLNKQFTAIAISETWLSLQETATADIEGYEMFYVSRTKRKGGGVALYINKNLRSKKMECMSLVVDDIMECVTVEIEIEKGQNIIISSVYRTPGSCIDTFRDQMVGMYSRLNNRKMLFVCGDFNIDLLNQQCQRNMFEFINSMYSLGLYPSITRPSRITTHSATLIDNIFTNVINKKVNSGLIINDTTDHLPVFAIIQSCSSEKIQATDYKIIRHKTEYAINSLKLHLMSHDWSEVYVEDVDEAYVCFCPK